MTDQITVNVKEWTVSEHLNKELSSMNTDRTNQIYVSQYLDSAYGYFFNSYSANRSSLSRRETSKYVKSAREQSIWRHEFSTFIFHLHVQVTTQVQFSSMWQRSSSQHGLRVPSTNPPSSTLAGKYCTVLLQFTGISNNCPLSQCRYQITNEDGIISHNFSVVYSVYSEALCPGNHHAALSLM